MKKKILNQLIAAALVCGSLLAVGNLPANAEEKIKKGLITENGHTYLYNGLGQKTTGMKANMSDKWYYFNDNGEMVKNTTVNIRGIDCTFDENGIEISENGVKIFNYGDEGTYENGKSYYVNKSGKKTGWVDVEGKVYYYNEKGEMQKDTTVKDLDGNEVKLNKNGVVVGKLGYELIYGEEITKDSSEAYKSSHKQWKKVGNDWYYYTGGKFENMLTGSWIKDNGVWYNFNDKGIMQKNTTVKDKKGNDCVLNADGALTNRDKPEEDFEAGYDFSWKQVDGNWYSIASNGNKETGWVQSNSKWYYCNKDGVMQKDTTIVENDIKYVLGTDGAWIN